MNTRLALSALVAALALAACDQSDSKPKPAAQRPGSSIAGPKSASAAPNNTDKPASPSAAAPKPMNTGGSPTNQLAPKPTPPAAPEATPDAPKPDAPKPETPMPSDAPKETVLKHTESNSGLIMDDMKFGDGVEAKAHQTVTIQYRGTLPSGAEFDSSYKTGKPATFPLDNLIKGWQEGIPGMKVGGKRRLIVPPDLGYGNREIKGADGKVLIPANSMLIFDIELIAVQ